MRNAVPLGGDADTMGAITVAVAEAFYGGVPADIAVEVRGRLAPALVEVVDRLRDEYM